jgi:hypothetical protein
MKDIFSFTPENMSFTFLGDEQNGWFYRLISSFYLFSNCINNFTCPCGGGYGLQVNSLSVIIWFRCGRNHIDWILTF